MQNINELVSRNLIRADQFAINQEIQRSIIADVSKTEKIVYKNIMIFYMILCNNYNNFYFHFKINLNFTIIIFF